jgi:hypothetical protein
MLHVMSSDVLKGNQLVVQFFDFFANNPKPDQFIDHQVKCKCGWIGKYKSSREYTNLQTHIISAHPEYASLMDNTKRNQRLLEDCFYPAKVKSYWTWLDWVIGEFLPFSFVENKQTRNQCNISPISVDTFIKMMNLLTVSVEEKIAALLPDTFELVFEGWTVGQTHYLAEFATYPNNDTELGYNKVCTSDQ